jgi:CBS domain-containing protein
LVSILIFETGKEEEMLLIYLLIFIISILSFFTFFKKFGKKVITVKTFMIPKEKLICVHPLKPISNTAAILIKNKIGCVLVLDEYEEEIGIVTRTDLITAFYSKK